MHKKINIIFALFLIAVVVSIFLLLLLRVDKYSKSTLINKNNESYILIKQNDFQKINNQNELKFKLHNQTFRVKNFQTIYIDNYTCIQLYDYFYLPSEIVQISVFLESKNILGF